jgi:hypothetical protein
MKDKNTAYFYAFVSSLLFLTVLFAPIDSVIIQLIIFLTMLFTAYSAFRLFKQVQLLRLSKTSSNLLSSYDYE